MSGNGNGNNLKPRQRQAIAALLVGSSVTAAAAAVGVAERTLHRWLKEDPDFMAELRAAEEQLIDATTRRLLDLQTAALDKIEDALNDDEAGHHVKLRAAGMVIDSALRLRELRNIEQRLTELEKQLEGS